ncbi:MAG: DUF1772 domain-containing protein [Ilumatobacter sp.]
MTIINAHPLTTTSTDHGSARRPRRAPSTSRVRRRTAAGAAHGPFSLAVALTLTGLFAGFFVTYSVSVVLGLARVDDITYVTTFQAINDTIRNAAFATFFFGCVPSIAWALAAHRTSGRRTIASLSCGLAACAGVILTTFLGNVPLNEELGAVIDLDASTAAAARSDFENLWNQLNLARAVLATIGLAAVAVAASFGRSAS